MKVQDTLGGPWLVLQGDPAWPLVERLKGTVVLPAETLVRAVVPHPGRIEELLRKLELAWRTTGDKDIKDAYLRAVALHDCLTKLYNEGGGTKED